MNKKAAIKTAITIPSVFFIFFGVAWLIQNHESMLSKIVGHITLIDLLLFLLIILIRRVYISFVEQERNDKEK